MSFAVAFPLAVLVAGTMATLTDWIFMGVLFHGHYTDHPEVWRPGVIGGNNTPAIIASSVLGYGMTAGIIYLCGLAAGDGLLPALGVATLVWLTAALPILVTNHLFIKLDWHVLVAHALGWWARMLIAGAAAAWLFGGWLR